MPNRNSIEVNETVDAIELIEPPVVTISKRASLKDDESNMPAEDVAEFAKPRSNVRTLSIMAALFVSIRIPLFICLLSRSPLFCGGRLLRCFKTTNP